MPPTPAPYRATITWKDAYGDLTRQVWDLADTQHAPLIIETVGWVTRFDSAGVTMFQERVSNQDGTFSWRAHGFIPSGMVVSVVPLDDRPPKRRKKAE